MFETSVNILLNYLTQLHPHRQIKYIGAGWSSIAFMLDEYVIRFPKHNLSDYEHEAELCNRLRDYVSVELPRCKVNYNSIYPYAKHRRIIGDLWDSNHRGNSIHELANDCAVFLYQIHAFDDLVGIRRAPNSNTIDTYKIENNLSRFYSGRSLDNICRMYELATNRKNQGDVLIHADFHGNNSVLSDCGRLKGVFDWCNSGIGERSKDFVNLYINMDMEFMEIVFHQYWQHSGIYIDIDRVRELSLLKLVNGLYWSNNMSDNISQLIEKMEKIIK